MACNSPFLKISYGACWHWFKLTDRSKQIPINQSWILVPTPYTTWGGPYRQVITLCHVSQKYNVSNYQGSKMLRSITASISTIMMYSAIWDEVMNTENSSQINCQLLTCSSTTSFKHTWSHLNHILQLHREIDKYAQWYVCMYWSTAQQMLSRWMKNMFFVINC